MLVSDIVRRVRDSAGDTAVLQFTQTTLTDWINDAVRECVLENSLLQARATSNTEIDQSEYTLPEDILKLHSVYVNGFKLEMLTLEQWEERNATELDASSLQSKSDPIVCYVYAGVLTLWPTPDKVLELKINYTKLPTPIVYNSTNETWLPNTPPINEAFHNRIVSYCLAQVALQDEDNYKYNLLMQEFITGVRNLSHVKDTEDDLYPFISVSSRDMGEWY